jgi:hypothetical protein
MSLIRWIEKSLKTLLRNIKMAPKYIGKTEMPIRANNCDLENL